MENATAYDVEIVHLLASPLHRYEGRPADGPLPAPEEPVSAVTVMAVESLEHVQEVLGVADPFALAAPRRNILLRGVDVDALKGQEFSLDSGQGEVLFQGHRAASPCGWMNVVLTEGAHKALRGRVGVRVEPLTDGTLALGPAVLRTRASVARQPTLA